MELCRDEGSEKTEDSLSFPFREDRTGRAILLLCLGSACVSADTVCVSIS